MLFIKKKKNSYDYYKNSSVEKMTFARKYIYDIHYNKTAVKIIVTFLNVYISV